MPIFLAALIGGLVSATGSIVGRVLIALGIGYVTYGGINGLLEWTKNELWTQMGFLPGEILNALAYMKVDVAVNIIFSAIAIRLTLNGFSSAGTITKTVIK